MCNQSFIRLVDVNKWFGSLHVLRGINLSVEKGERVIVCGPSGSGKSTLIRCINCLETHQEGQIFVDGVELGGTMKRVDLLRRDVGMVFQSFNLFPHLSAVENITLGLTVVRKMPEKEASRWALQCLERVRLIDQANKHPGQLSGGQQQRVAIARALAMQPKVMLFDEPTSALDPEMIKEVLDVMIELANDGMTMIVVTHELGFARTAANKVVFMADGQVMEEATTSEFFSNPQNPRLRTFLNQVLSHD